VRYDPDRFEPASVTAPPYDVIDDDDRAALLARDPYNVVRIDLPRDEGGEGRYAVAERVWNEWLDEGALVIDEEPAFYVYRMGYRDDAGRPRQTTGIIGALELSRPGEGGILPHEHTTPKATTSPRSGGCRGWRASPPWARGRGRPTGPGATTTASTTVCGR
jgi:uncharacterized protein (DUF1015 family)